VCLLFAGKWQRKKTIALPLNSLFISLVYQAFVGEGKGNSCPRLVLAFLVLVREKKGLFGNP